MKRLSLLALLLGVGCDWMPGRPTRAERPVTANQVTDFNTLWTTNCSGCHGANGRDGAARPMHDPVYLALASDDYLTHITTYGVDNTLMPPMAESEGGPMTTEQVNIVVRGMRNAWSGAADITTAPALTSAAAAGSATTGEALFTSYCSACHGDDGTGTDKAGSVVDSSYLAMTSDQALRSTVICGRIDLGMPDWASRKGLPALTGAQVDDLVAWLTSHRLRHPGAPGASVIDGDAS